MAVEQAMSGPGCRRASRTAPVRPTPPASCLVRDALRLPAFWLLVVLLLVGAGRLGVVLQAAYAAHPWATAFALLLFTLYAVPFLLFVQHVDYFEPEPPVLLAAAFAWGGLVAMTASIAGNSALDNLIAKVGSPALAAAWGPALVGPTVEEPLKLLGVVLIALIAGTQINSVVDGFVYGALVGLGFQVLENVVYAVNAVGEAGVGAGVGPVLTTLIVRGFVAGLWSHTLFSAMAGAGVGYVMVRRDRTLAARLGFAGFCLFGAWLCHGIWNSPLLADGLHLPPAGTPVELLVKGIPALVVILALVREATYREAAYYSEVLLDADNSRIATPAEVQTLASASRRAAARRAAWARAGPRGAWAVARLHRAQARLAVELSRAGNDALADDCVLARRYREVLRSRYQLRALGAGDATRRADEAGRRDLQRRSGWATWLLGGGIAAALGYALSFVAHALSR